MINRYITKVVEDTLSRNKSAVLLEIRKEAEKLIDTLLYKHVVEVVNDPLSERVQVRIGGRIETVPTLLGELRNTVADKVLEEIDMRATTAVRSAVSGEDFIDHVVERISKKQL